MRKRKSGKYKNYGPIPQNEYTTNSGKSTATPAVLEVEPQAGDTAYGRRLMERQAQHPSGRRKVYGWLRLSKANGWRAESASQDDDLTDMEKHSY